MTKRIDFTKLTHEVMLKEFDYDPEGHLVWKSVRPGRKVGSRVGSAVKSRRCPRVFVKFAGFTWQAHRLIYFWHHNELPEIVDHINHDGLDNRIENLRAADGFQNQWNRKHRKSGNVGKCKGGWNACVKAHGVNHIRFAKTREQALAYAAEMRLQLHGEFAS